MAAQSAITTRSRPHTLWKKGHSGNPSGRPKRTPEEIELIEACRLKTPDALNVIQDLMVHSTNDRVRLAAAQFIIERGYGKAPERIELINEKERERQEQELQRGAELTAQEAYLQLIKHKTFERVPACSGEEKVGDGVNYKVIELEV
jgi:hypothetical protein